MKIAISIAILAGSLASPPALGRPAAAFVSPSLPVQSAKLDSQAEKLLEQARFEERKNRIRLGELARLYVLAQEQELEEDVLRIRELGRLQRESYRRKLAAIHGQLSEGAFELVEADLTRGRLRNPRRKLPPELVPLEYAIEKRHITRAENKDLPPTLNQIKRREEWEKKKLRRDQLEANKRKRNKNLREKAEQRRAEQPPPPPKRKYDPERAKRRRERALKKKDNQPPR